MPGWAARSPAAGAAQLPDGPHHPLPAPTRRRAPAATPPLGVRARSRPRVDPGAGVFHAPECIVRSARGHTPGDRVRQSPVARAAGASDEHHDHDRLTIGSDGRQAEPRAQTDRQGGPRAGGSPLRSGPARPATAGGGGGDLLRGERRLHRRPVPHRLQDRPRYPAPLSLGLADGLGRQRHARRRSRSGLRDLRRPGPRGADHAAGPANRRRGSADL